MIKSSGRIGIGTAAPGAKLQVIPTVATDIGLIVKGYTAQSANLQQWQDPNGGVVANVDIYGNVSGNKAGVYAYLSAASSTTVTSAGTYYPIVGTFTNSPMYDFIGTSTSYGPGIQYIGTTTKTFETLWSASFYCDQNGTTGTVGITQNGIVATSSKMSQYCKTATELYTSSGVFVTTLVKNDVIQLVFTSDKTGGICTFNNFTTSIKQFFY